MSFNSTLTEAEVIATERVRLADRRTNAGLELPADNHPGATSTAESIQAPPVGLAVSGGGVRSASMALGLFQALYRRGLLAQIDYLSTVSGGSYAGSMLSSQIATSTGAVDWTPEDGQTRPNANCLPIYSERNAPQPKLVQQMATAGENLKKPLKFLSRHLWGLLTVNAWVLSGLVALSALAAYLFRFFDTPEAMLYVNELGFHTDIARAFFPATMAFVLWLFTAAISGVFSRRFEKFPQFSTAAYTLLLLTLALGTVSLFSTGNLDLYFFEQTAGVDSTFGDRVRAGLNWAGQGLIVVFFFAVAPYLNMKALVRSGTQPRNRVEGWVFNLASTTLLLGAPLALFYYLSIENISGYNKSREFPNSLSIGHVRDWKRLLQELRLRDFAMPQTGDSPEDLKKVRENGVATPPPRTPVEWNDRTLKSNASNQILHAFGGSDVELNRLWKDLDDNRPAQPASGDQPPGGTASDPPQESEWQTQCSRGDSRLEAYNNFSDALLEKQKQLQFFEPTLDFLGSLVQNTEFSDRLQRARRQTRLLESLVDALNWQVLANPDFCQELAVAPNRQESPSDATVAKFVPDRELPDSLLEPHLRLAVLQKLLQHAHVTRSAAEKTLNQYSPKSKGTLVTRLRSAYETARHAADSHTFNEDDTKTARKTRDALREQISQVQLANWNILRLLYGKENFYPPREVFATVVAVQDQKVRARILLYSTLIFLTLGVCVAVNPTMMHGFYRDQLSPVWIQPLPHYGRAIPIRLLDTMAKGGPLHLINATLNLTGAEGVGGQATAERFVFSSMHVGSRRTGYLSTQEYEDGECKLDDVTAISGAAISPVATENVIVRLLLILFNLRLGQWLPNPRKKLWSRAWATPLRLLSEFLTLPPENRSYLFVSDGGHYENTGIETLFQRRCRVIIAADFSQDDDYSFSDFRRLLLRTASTEGVRLVPGSGRPGDDPLLDLVPHHETRLAKSHCALYRIEYVPIAGETPVSDVRSGWLILIKPGFTGDEPPGLRESRRDYGAFPHDSTVDQLFESTRFLAYRQLGEHLGDTLCEQFFGRELRGNDRTAVPNRRLWLARDWNPGSPSRRVEPAASEQTATPSTPLPAATPAQSMADELAFLEELAKSGLNAERTATVCRLLQGPGLEERELTIRCLWESGQRGDLGLRRKIAETLCGILKNPQYFAGVPNPTCQRIDLLKALDTVGHRSMPFVQELLRSLQADPNEAVAVRQYCTQLLERPRRRQAEHH